MAVQTYMQCPDCNGQMQVNFGENTFFNQLSWSVSYHCSQCGHAEELDGYNQLPEDLRQIELTHNGIWELELVAFGGKIGSSP